MDYLELLDSYYDEMISTMADSISFPSVAGEAVRSADGKVMPFGRGVQDAFDHIMKVGSEMGFDTFNADNYGGHIEFPAEDPESAETFGITVHADVVPEGDGWETDPYTLTEKDGYLYGRGLADDKGPMIICLYAMKALKEAGKVPKKNIRLIIGLDEEVGCEGMPVYLKKAGHPDLGFTPDAEFPLINGEMGTLIFNMAQKLTRINIKEGLRLTKLEAGVVANAVPGSCRAVVTGGDEWYRIIKDRIAQYSLEKGYDIKARKQGSSLVLETAGKVAHGALPHLGLNAASIMMDFLGRLEFANDELNDFIAFYNDHIGFDLHGERLGCDLEDGPSGKLILNIGMVSISEDLADLTVNIRYPVTCSDDEVFSGIESVIADTPIGIVKGKQAEPLFIDINDPLVEKLMDAYREETGDTDSVPMVIGGGTYAKYVNRTLAFGGLFPGEEDTMHQPNERKSIELLRKMTHIYAKAIYSICCE